MKKLILIMVLFASFSFAQEFRLVFADTIDAVNDTFYVDIPENVDSITFSLYCVGEIDLDTLTVYKGIKTDNVFKSNSSLSEFDIERYVYDSNTAFVLTIDLDSAATSYTVLSAGISDSLLTGYNRLMGVISADATGSDVTDVGQKAVVYAIIYKSVNILKEE